MKRHLFASLLVGALVYTTPTLLHAASAKPKFLMTPTTATHFSITNNDTATVQYTVLNQTKIARTLTMKPITGISQVTTGTNVCANPFTLQPNASCLLTLAVGASEFGFDISGGPEVCKTQSAGNNTPDPFLCSQPAKANQLAISRKTSPLPPVLTISPSFLNLLTSGSARGMTVTNNSFILTANNVQANFDDTLLNGNVTQDASDCTIIEPRDSCTILFTPGATPISETSFAIQGSNTSVFGASIQITTPLTAVIRRSPDALTFLAETTSNPVTVTNQSRSVTATNIAADLTGISGVTQTPSGCASVAPGGTCTLTFTSTSPTPVPSINVPIYGTNTTHTSVNIAVNGASQIPIAVNPSSLTFTANGVDLQTMTITNNSTTSTALNIAPDTGPLSGVVTLVSNDCQSVPHGDTCTLSFQATTTSTDDPIQFNIQGDNTTAVTGTITVNPVNYAYVGNFDSNNISKCKLDRDTDLSDCSLTGLGVGPIHAPTGMVLNTDNSYIYIGGNHFFDGNPSWGGTLSICYIQPVTGVLNCGEGEQVVVPNNPSVEGIAINPDNTFIYMGLSTNPGSPNNIIYMCPVSEGGSIVGECVDSNASNMPAEGMQQLSINPTGTLVYFVTGDSGVYHCPVNGDGSLGACSPTNPSGLPLPLRSIAITSGNDFAYIGGGTGVSGCQVDSNGDLFDCHLTDVSSDIIGDGDDIKINSTNTRAYLATFDASNTPYTAICDVNGTTVSNCRVGASAPDGAFRSVSIALLQ